MVFNVSNLLECVLHVWNRNKTKFALDKRTLLIYTTYVCIRTFICKFVQLFL